MNYLDIAKNILLLIYKNNNITNINNIYEFASQNRYIFKFRTNNNYYVLKLVENKLDTTRINTVNCMKLARKHLGDIIPRIHYNGNYKYYDYIIMDYIEGSLLVKIWDDLNNDNKNKIKNQLSEFLKIMRSIEFNFIGSIISIDNELIPGPVTDYNIAEGKNINKWDRGPFLCIEEWLISGLLLEINNIDNNYIINKVLNLIDYLKKGHNLFDSKYVKFVLSHGDFDMWNIIVDKEFNVKGIIDWEYSGSYPIYYEYIKRDLAKSEIKEIFEVFIEKKLLEIEYIKQNICKNNEKIIERINFLLKDKSS